MEIITFETLGQKLGSGKNSMMNRLTIRPENPENRERRNRLILSMSVFHSCQIWAEIRPYLHTNWTNPRILVLSTLRNGLIGGFINSLMSLN